jgi:hypothetical protein
MPDFIVTSPDGKKFRVSAPEGATADDALAHVMANLPKDPLKEQPHVPTRRQEAAPEAAGFDPGDLGGIGEIASAVSGPGILQAFKDFRNEGSRLIGEGLQAVAPKGSAFEGWAKRQTGIVERRNARDNQDYEASRGPEAGFDGGRLVGNVMTALPFSGPRAATALGKFASNVFSGGVAAPLTQPTSGPAEDYWGEKATQAGFGGGGAAVATPVMGLLGRVVAPKATRDPNVQKLLEEGVPLPPGQMSGGAFRRVENALDHIPFVGDLVRNRGRNAVEGLDRAAINRSLKPIGQQLPKDIDVGREGVAFAQDTIGDAYGRVLSRMPAIRLDQQFNQDLAALNQVSASLPGDLAKAFDGYVQQRLVPRLANGGVMDGQTMKMVDGELGLLAKNYSTSSDAGQRELGKVFRDLKGVVFGLAERNYPAEAPALKRLAEAYGNLAVVENAAGMAGAKGGVFSPNQLNAAVKKGDPSVRDRQFAAGRARMQDLSDAASAVMPPTVPDSGTALRMFTGAGLLGGGGMAGHLAGADPLHLAAAALPPAVASLLYSPWGRTGAEYALGRGASWRVPLAKGLLGAAPSVGAAVGPPMLDPRLGLLQ